MLDYDYNVALSRKIFTKDDLFDEPMWNAVGRTTPVHDYGHIISLRSERGSPRKSVSLTVFRTDVMNESDVKRPRGFPVSKQKRKKQTLAQKTHNTRSKTKETMKRLDMLPPSADIEPLKSNKRSLRKSQSTDITQSKKNSTDTASLYKKKRRKRQ